ncbi:F0F1 ATP synthase subunit epsilon [Acidipropionibacterium jensenii]|uniref:ATP synthase epsilon chain n=1 Tax=Acidipropionibacterium jensenii TaxID=1749 RepID=A0A3Q9UJ54_9ACTN|nr:F0F1 ATP synthase subunit epsilon [Acidipropionibacterium jensenii]AZZ39348.1 F0F1 ATP synthase subunit epsilon [Acidipropionibacterium jensenii]MDN5976422.1 F0F1 ATP synthase subunit epsilon [Acidipropionibacterium jensenii]MDN5995163.1 F0F1 ATP synthase subunit epsilon [Acidipropionibacterium jensenii]MDN6425793.1 F0F1 ATP synthase subunit epsilon [Acidipropionibacterium jensenii]MDN6440818.1 F0F1 ATP synthase subunit epsilon [Acidipropionibacterium jensenii]
MAPKPLHVDVVAADRQIWEGDAVNIILRTTEGDIGLLPGHTPIFANLVPCAARIITDDGRQEVIAVDGGYVALDDSGRVSILAQYATRSDEISSADAQHEIDVISRKMDRNDEYTEDDVHRLHLAQAQLLAAKHISGQKP